MISVAAMHSDFRKSVFFDSRVNKPTRALKN